MGNPKKPKLSPHDQSLVDALSSMHEARPEDWDSLLTQEDSEGRLISWSELKGMSHDEAERYMAEVWGLEDLPPIWDYPFLRDMITGVRESEVVAHMNDGTLKYGGNDRLGDDAAAVWYQRNIDGQGYPGVE